MGTGHHQKTSWHRNDISLHREQLTKLTERAERTGVPVEGWLHFRVNGVHENEVGATVYRLNVLTLSGAVSTDILGTRNLAAVRGAEFLKLPFAARSLGSVAH